MLLFILNLLDSTKTNKIFNILNRIHSQQHQDVYVSFKCFHSLNLYELL